MRPSSRSARRRTSRSRGADADALAKRMIATDIAKQIGEDTSKASLATTKFEGDYNRIMTAATPAGARRDGKDPRRRRTRDSRQRSAWRRSRPKRRNNSDAPKASRGREVRWPLTRRPELQRMRTSASASVRKRVASTIRRGQTAKAAWRSVRTMSSALVAQEVATRFFGERNCQGVRLNTALVLRSRRRRRLEGRSRSRRGDRWSVLRDASPSAPLLRTRPSVGCLAVTGERLQLGDLEARRRSLEDRCAFAVRGEGEPCALRTSLKVL